MRLIPHKRFIRERQHAGIVAMTLHQEPFDKQAKQFYIATQHMTEHYLFEAVAAHVEDLHGQALELATVSG